MKKTTMVARICNQCSCPELVEKSEEENPCHCGLHDFQVIAEFESIHLYAHDILNISQALPDYKPSLN